MFSKVLCVAYPGKELSPLGYIMVFSKCSNIRRVGIRVVALRIHTLPALDSLICDHINGCSLLCWTYSDKISGILGLRLD